jgi:type II secretory ATPase GspE/PulE/Tfp pilus assembly ATPase PilB-like protein
MSSSGLPPIPFSAEYLEYNGIIPLSQDEREVRIGSWRDQLDPAVLDDMRLVFEREPRTVSISEAEGLTLIRRLRAREHSAEPVDEEIVKAAERETIHATGDLLALANEAPVVRLVNLLMTDATEAGASDVHIEQTDSGAVARFRVDGILQEVAAPPDQLAAAVISRIKVMAELDVAERRRPQDGRMRLRVHDRAIDVRVSCVPVLHGESIVMRLLDSSTRHIGLDELGFLSADLALFREAIRRPHGIILATGPTGSGKTTTLYAALSDINSGREKIITLEDPIEYQLAGAAQVPVSPRVPFATALRSLLRQDPDILLIGEIRDRETAEIAMHAALTGHLVFSTLHTNDAVGAVTRLMNMGLPPYLIAATLQAVVAQRLVRRACEQCATMREADQAMALALTNGGSGLLHETYGHGCDACRSTGYRGRAAVYELLLIDRLREAVEEGQTKSRLDLVAVDRGMRTLRQHAIELVRSGITTVAEALRVLGSIEADRTAPEP